MKKKGHLIKSKEIQVWTLINNYVLILINISDNINSKEHEKLGTGYTGIISNFSVNLKLSYNKRLLKYVIYDSIYINFKENKGSQNQTIVFRHTCLNSKI